MTIVWIILLLLLLFFLYLTDVSYHNSIFTPLPVFDKKIAILTLEDRDEEYVRCHNTSVTSYCKKHGYDYIFQKNKYPSNLPVYWHKLLFVQEHLPKYDYVLWLDSDTLILDDTIPLEHLIDGTHFYIGTDWYPFIESHRSFWKTYNSGIFMVRN